MRYQAALLLKVCHVVHTEPPLLPLSKEKFHYRTANVEDGAHLDVSAESFWGRDRKMVSFDISCIYVSFALARCFCHAKLDKSI